LRLGSHLRRSPTQHKVESNVTRPWFSSGLTKAGRRPLVKPGPLKPAVEGGFTLDDFTVDETAGTVTCPNGLTRRITPSRSVAFGAGCRGCPLRAQCTNAKDGRNLILHKHHGLLSEHRKRAKDPAWQADYRQHRPMVEGPSPGSSETGTARSDTAASARTTPGCTTAAPPSTFAGCSTSA